jgi:hypothetical protein
VIAKELLMGRDVDEALPEAKASSKEASSDAGGMSADKQPATA